MATGLLGWLKPAVGGREAGWGRKWCWVQQKPWLTVGCVSRLIWLLRLVSSLGKGPCSYVPAWTDSHGRLPLGGRGKVLEWGGFLQRERSNFRRELPVGGSSANKTPNSWGNKKKTVTIFCRVTHEEVESIFATLTFDWALWLALSSGTGACVQEESVKGLSFAMAYLLAYLWLRAYLLLICYGEPSTSIGRSPG